MPELPEMENYRRLLNQRIAAQTITQVQINRPKSINVTPDVFITNVLHQKVNRVERRAKHLLFYLENSRVLLLHLMLGGWMFFGTAEDKPDRTVQVQLTFSQQHLYFIGLRLGYLHLYMNEDEVKQVLSDLGPEPLKDEFTLEFFQKHIRSKRGRLKTALVDQRFLSGIGNCYSDEICFHAKLLPTRNIRELTEHEVRALYHSTRHVLKDATEGGGYMEHPFFKGDQLTGGYDERCQVYDREDEACFRCGATIKKEMLSARKMFFCLGCQH